MNKKQLAVLLLSPFLIGCGNTQLADQSRSNVSANPNNPFAGGGGGAQALAPETTQQAAGSANWGSDRTTQQHPGPKRGRLLAPAEPVVQPKKPVDPYAEKYDKWRLEKAATIRNWASVSMYPNGIDAFLHTVWIQGVMHVRVALLGPLENLRIFARDHQSVKLAFQDQDGNYMQSLTIPMSMFKEASPGTNGGNPTYFVEGQYEVPLETYERYYQWVFEWE